VVGCFPERRSIKTIVSRGLPGHCRAPANCRTLNRLQQELIGTGGRWI
jgi:hypothetical protein